MYSFMEAQNKSFEDFNLLFCGKQECAGGYSFGPAVRPHYLLHICLKGKGYYFTGEEKYTVHQGEGFLILPDKVTYYEADQKTPWTYLWVGFDGTKAQYYLSLCNLDAAHLICRCDALEALSACVDEMLQRNRASYANELYLQGLLFRFFGILAESAGVSYPADVTKGNAYVSKAMEYMKRNYQNSVTISEIASYVSLNRSYLTTIFQNTLGMSPQQYLLKFRMIQASELLTNTDLPVGQIARSCGYCDPLTFSRVFKKTWGLSPSSYRRERRTGKAAHAREAEPHGETL